MNVVLDQKEKELRNWTYFKASHEVAHQLVIDNKRINGLHIICLTWMVDFVQSKKITLTGTDNLSGDKGYWISTNEFLAQIGEMCNCYTEDQAKKFMTIMSEIYFANPLTGKKERLIPREVVLKKKSLYFPNWVLINFLLANPYQDKALVYPSEDVAKHYNIDTSKIKDKVQLFVRNSLLNPTRNHGICAKNESICAYTAQTGAPQAQSCAENEEEISNSARNRIVNIEREKKEKTPKEQTTTNGNTGSSFEKKDGLSNSSLLDNSFNSPLEDKKYNDPLDIRYFIHQKLIKIDSKKSLDDWNKDFELKAIHDGLESYISQGVKADSADNYLYTIVKSKTTIPILPPTKSGVEKIDRSKRISVLDQRYLEKENSKLLQDFQEAKKIKSEEEAAKQRNKGKTLSPTEILKNYYKCPDCGDCFNNTIDICQNCGATFDYSDAKARDKERKSKIYTYKDKTYTYQQMEDMQLRLENLAIKESWNTAAEKKELNELSKMMYELDKQRGYM